MMLFRGVLAVGALVVMATAVSAAECDTSSDQSFLDTCALREYRAADAQLNEAYSELKAGYEEPFRTALVKSQRAWIAFRDAECALVRLPNKGSSVEKMVHNQCLTQVTLKRLTDIRFKVSCQVGMLDCIALDNRAAD